MSGAWRGRSATARVRVRRAERVLPPLVAMRLRTARHNGRYWRPCAPSSGIIIRIFWASRAAKALRPVWALAGRGAPRRHRGAFRVSCGTADAALGVLRLHSGRIIAALPLVLAVSRRPVPSGVAVAACGLAVYKHRANIQRLRAGTEPKVCLPWNKKTKIKPKRRMMR